MLAHLDVEAKVAIYRCVYVQALARSAKELGNALVALVNLTWWHLVDFKDFLLSALQALYQFRGIGTIPFTTRHLLKDVSIHAPTWGATAVVGCRLRCMAFQSTRPRGARPLQDVFTETRGQFQSTRPRGARRKVKRNMEE